MDVQQLKEEKQKLTNAIAILVSDFTADTGLTVTYIDIQHISTFDEAVAGYIIDVECSL